MKKLYTIVSLLITIAWFNYSFASHYRAGEITFRYITGYKYEITLSLITADTNASDSCLMELNFGDGNIPEIIPDTAKFESVMIVKEHTYPGPGVYIISLRACYMITGIENIPGSDTIPLYLESFLNISPFGDVNNSVIFDFPPIENGYVNEIFQFTPGAHDSDGDSLYFSLAPCYSVQNYQYPDQAGGGILSINSSTGTLTWDSPSMPGVFNVGILTGEFRNGKNIGYTYREFEIIIREAPQSNEELIYNIVPAAFFPNPSTNEISFTVPMEKHDYYLALVYNSEGRMVYNSEFSRLNLSINISSLQNGCYFYKLILCDGNTIASGKFLKESNE